MARALSPLSKALNKLKQGSAPFIEHFKVCAKQELRPPSIRDIPKAMNQFKDIALAAKAGRIKNITVNEAWLNALVCVEVATWFFIGECIGKFHYVGYNV